MKNYFTVLSIALLLVNCSQKKEQLQDAQQSEEQAGTDVKAANELPQMTLTFQDNSKLNVRELNREKAILIFFIPDCDHCQHEATDIQKRLDAFRQYKIYFISSAPISEISKFASDYKLNFEPNIQFASTSPDEVINNYGGIQAPSIYIYDGGKLKQSFNGQTDVNEIIAAL